MKINDKVLVDKMTLLSMIYLLMIVFLSIANIEYNLLIFCMYFFLALPFVKSPEHFLCIVLLVLTISYYFLGADSTFYNLTTILLIIYIINIIMTKSKKFKISLKNFLPVIGLIVIAVISYNHSPFGYTNGLIRFLYMMIVTLIIGNFVQININKCINVLSKLALVLLFGYIITIMFFHSFVYGRLTIANSVNTNTFGMSCAQLTCILFLSYYFLGKKIIYLFGTIIAVLLAFLSGSRGAILAAFATCGTIVFINEKREGKLTGLLAKIIPLFLIVIVLFYIVSSFISIDMSRFSFESLFSETGSGTTRLQIIESIIPYIINNKFYVFGYGPGHECSRIVIKSLILWNFSHTHNTLLESFGELGIGGLVFTISCLLYSIKKCLKNSKKYKNEYILLGMLFCIFLNGMAESYFYDMFFWMLLGITRNNFLQNKEE